MLTCKDKEELVSLGLVLSSTNTQENNIYYPQYSHLTLNKPLFSDTPCKEEILRVFHPLLIDITILASRSISPPIRSMRVIYLQECSKGYCVRLYIDSNYKKVVSNTVAWDVILLTVIEEVMLLHEYNTSNKDASLCVMINEYCSKLLKKYLELSTILRDVPFSSLSELHQIANC